MRDVSLMLSDDNLDLLYLYTIVSKRERGQLESLKLVPGWFAEERRTTKNVNLLSELPRAFKLRTIYPKISRMSSLN